MNQLFHEIWQRLRTDRRAALALVLALAANLLIAGLYIWSRGGQTTVVSVTAAGDAASVAVDGRLQRIAPDLEGVPPSGGIVLTLSDTESVPSLPRPRGIASVRVLSFPTGEVLFEDDFSDGLDEGWVVSGEAVFSDGLVGSRGDAQLALTGPDWRDVMVDVTYRNVQSAGIIVRARPDLYGVAATVRPFHWNEDDSKWISITAGRPGAEAAGGDIYLGRRESMKSLFAMLTRPYPYVLLLGLVAVLIVAIAQWAPPGIAARMEEWSGQAAVGVWAAVLAAVTFVVLAATNVVNLEHMPYVPDSIAYVFQAKIFASFRLTADPPPVEGAFDFFRPPPFALTETSWAAQYPFAHPLALAVGQLLGAPWLVPPLLGAGSVWLMFVVGRRAYNARSGLLAAVLLASSPFFIMNASDFMSHNTAAFFLLASLACVLMRDRRPLLFGALGGLAFGLLLNTRPLTAAALSAPFGVWMLLQLVPRETRRAELLRIAAFGAAGAVMALLFLGWNYTITGDAFQTGYQSTGVSFFDTSGPAPEPQPAGGVPAALGSGGQHDSALGIGNERMQLALLLLVLHGWPQFIGLAFSLLPFLLGTRKPHDWFFLACAVAATGVWVTYESTGVMYGPRYWYEAMPFLMLLAARGADRAADLIASGVAAGQERRLDAEPALPWARVAVFGFVGVLVALSLYGWLLGQRATWQADLVPNRASAMCCVLGVDDRIPQLVQERDLHNALVLVDPCGNNFVCYGSVFWRNNPTLDGDIVYARDDADKRDEIIAAYPGRDVYLATYIGGPTLVPLGAPSSSGGTHEPQDQ
jgi:hypothetical protein